MKIRKPTTSAKLQFIPPFLISPTNLSFTYFHPLFHNINTTGLNKKIFNIN